MSTLLYLIQQQANSRGVFSSQSLNQVEKLIKGEIPQFGQGYARNFRFRDGLELLIQDVKLEQTLVFQNTPRPHPIELEFCLNGQGINEYGKPVTSGYYCLISNGSAPGGKVQYQRKQRLFGIAIHLPPQLLETIFNDPLKQFIQPKTEPTYIKIGKISPRMMLILKQVTQSAFQGLTKQIFLEGKTLELISLVLEDLQIICPQKNDYTDLATEELDRVYYAKTILTQQFQNPPSLRELARLVGLNECTLKKQFKQVFQTTIFGYLFDYRMQYAYELLLESQFTAQQIAFSVGYTSPSAFAAAFKRKFGFPPTAIKNSVSQQHFSRSR